MNLTGSIITAVLGTVLAIVLPYLLRSLHRDKYERILIHGRSAKPGLPEILPIGTRLLNVEELVRNTNYIIHLIYQELSNNDGSSFRDKVEAGLLDASESAKSAAHLDKLMAQHFNIIEE